jgi:lipoprotein-anchoring transpeptidase ErfK/SrfK
VLERSIPLTDYYSILSRAVGTLKPNTAQTRSALFSRARQMLVDQINHEPQFWSDAAAEAELGRFDAATDRIEVGFANRFAIEPRDEIPRHQPQYPDPDATHPYRDNLPKFTIGRVAILGAVGLSALLGIGIGVYSLRGGSETTVTQPAQTRTPPATRTASRPALGGDEVEPGVDGGSTDTMLPYHMRRQAVYYRSVYSEGMLLVDRSQRFLYLIQPQSRAVRYGIGVGGECDVSAGLYRIQRTAQWPEWLPTPAVQKRYSFPARFAGGPGNPLGAAAMYLEDNTPAIHGTNSPKTIGQAPVIGCFRLVNDDVVDLGKRVQAGTAVVVLN